MDHETLIKILNNRLATIEDLQSNFNGDSYIAWMELLRRILIRAFGPNSIHHNKIFKNIDFSDPDRALIETRPHLLSYIREVEEEGLPRRLREREPETPFKRTNKVFLAHGRDEKALEELEELLRKYDLEPIILRDQPDAGRTIIQKLEDEAQGIGYAFVLLTPDDLGCLASTYNGDNLETRPRQNTLFEYGYLIGLIGRENVCCVCKEGLEDFASDILGVLYKPFKESVFDAEESIRLDIQAAHESGRIIACA